MQIELYGSRAALRAAKRIANPGCYATSAQLLLAPLRPLLDDARPPTVFGVSGYSGAGTVPGAADPDGRPTTAAKVTPAALAGGIKPYALTDHIHEREAGGRLGVPLAFVPSVAPWFSGITSVASVPLAFKTSAAEVRALYEEAYAGEKLVTMKKDVPILSDIENKHGWTMGGVQVHSSGTRVVVAGGLDNLLKGAATQCIQVRAGREAAVPCLMHLRT